MAAVATGADEFCLTAHHEGGVALWHTTYSSYSVPRSPYGTDALPKLGASPRQPAARPC